MFKKSKTICFFAMLVLALFPFISTGSSVYASESYNQKVNEIEKVVDNQLKKMENMTPAEKLDEVNRLLSQYEGATVNFADAVSPDMPVLRNARPSTELRIVNGGLNFYAYNQAGINKLADLFAKLGLMEGASGGSRGIAAAIAGAMDIATAGLAAVVVALGSYASYRFATANGIMRDHEKDGDTKAGARITITETLDITKMGINAYA
ncbi:hypothetical protein DKB98_06055 [Enterococcus faecalis]|uniref:hypothetical protein n=1 Tax=Enterococcus faecalis TaxID=1351 RepID=UPI000D673E51|nr:hypothetical protein [Enterococcus faecalis]PWI82977.1 hypothetical protein DKC02_03630 [Enterococcus faecalis]PWI85185.1 hypothetical protein DKC03_12640 [Enterococcus faecalis]PWI87895.1 hypothetical protein DKB98_06055 [Enterococcus faecalis]